MMKRSPSSRDDQERHRVARPGAGGSIVATTLSIEKFRDTGVSFNRAWMSSLTLGLLLGIAQEIVIAVTAQTSTDRVMWAVFAFMLSAADLLLLVKFRLPVFKDPRRGIIEFVMVAVVIIGVPLATVASAHSALLSWVGPAVMIVYLLPDFRLLQRQHSDCVDNGTSYRGTRS